MGLPLWFIFFLILLWNLTVIRRQNSKIEGLPPGHQNAFDQKYIKKLKYHHKYTKNIAVYNKYIAQWKIVPKFCLKFIEKNNGLKSVLKNIVCGYFSTKPPKSPTGRNPPDFMKFLWKCIKKSNNFAKISKPENLKISTKNLDLADRRRSTVFPKIIQKLCKIDFFCH